MFVLNTVGGNLFSQIVTDGTVGAARTLTGPDYAIGADLGVIHGSNLFHSFGQFNIQGGQSATFSGPASITNILSRVTGGNSSTIDGLLRSEISGADLYLLNPAGVVFGPNAQIDISGGFHVSTADHITLGNGGRFDAGAPAASLLNSEPVEAFGFVRDNPASVSIQGSNIRADPGRNVSVIAGNIDIENATIRTVGGDVTLIGVDSSGTVSRDVADSESISDVQSFSELAEINLTDSAHVNTDGEGGGRITIIGGDVLIEDSFLFARTHGEVSGRGIEISADHVSLVRGRIDTRTHHAGAAGDILISAASMTLDGRNATSTFGIFSNSTAITTGREFADFRLTLDITHAFDWDVEARLISPEGTDILLFSRVDIGENFTGSTFDDAAEIAIDSGSAPFSGVFRPSESFTKLGGESLSGVWTLRLEDPYAPGDGTLNSWSLTVGGESFVGADFPHDISDRLPAVESSITIDAPGRSVEVNPEFTPGPAGKINITTGSLAVFGDVNLTSTAQTPGDHGAITVSADSITQNDLEAVFVTNFTGFGRFNSALTQQNIVVRDTLGASHILSGPEYLISSDFGHVFGDNLFLSFDQFSLDPGETATFSGAPSITNILVRVTGGEASNIDGVIRSEIVDAEMFFLNPAGIMLGPNASLDINGAVTISTANYIGLGTNGRFNGTLSNDDVLSVDPPSEFGFFDSEPAALTIDGSHLSTLPGRALALIAGDIDLLSSSIIPGGDLFIVSVASPGQIVRESDSPNTLLTAESVAEFGAISLRDVHISDANNGPGGIGVAIQSGDWRLTNSEITSQSSTDADGMDIDIVADGELRLLHSRISTGAHASGNAGDVVITAETIDLENRSRVSTDTSGTGAGGNIIISADEMEVMDGSALYQRGNIDGGITLDISSDLILQRNATIESGRGIVSIAADNVSITDSSGIDVNIDGFSFSSIGGDIALSLTGDFRLQERSFLGSDPFFIGNGLYGGNTAVSAANIVVEDGFISANGEDGRLFGAAAIALNAEDNIIVRQFSRITSIAANTGFLRPEANPSIQLAAGDLLLEEASEISILVPSEFHSGEIDVSVRHSATIRNSTIATGGLLMFPGGDTFTEPAVGDIHIRADNLHIDSSRIGAETSAPDDERNGDVLIDVAGEVVLDHSAVVSVESFFDANAGAISVIADSLLLHNGSQIRATTHGNGQGGKINASAQRIAISGTSASMNSVIHPSSIESAARGISGDGGAIRIHSEALVLSNGGRIDTSTSHAGTAGVIEVTGGAIGLHSGAQISSRSISDGHAGSAGRINIGTINNPVASLEIIGDAAITTDAVNAGGGRVNVFAQDLVYLAHSQVTTSVADGTGFGGDIFIDPTNVVLNHSQILAQAFAGDGGAITIITDNFIPSNDSIVSATSQRGNNGTVEIVAPETDINADLIPLLGDFLDAASWTVERCSARLGNNVSSLTVTTFNGVPTAHDDLHANLELIGSDVGSAGERKIRKFDTTYDLPKSGCRGCD